MTSAITITMKMLEKAVFRNEYEYCIGTNGIGRDAREQALAYMIVRVGL